MKKLFLATITTLLMVNCSTNDSYEDNPYIPDYSFDTGTLINTNLPKYNALNFPGNYILLDSPYGVNGVVLYYIGAGMYTAFELTDPNHAITSCSTLEVNGIIATCDCDDDNSYNIVNGYPESDTTGEYTLKPYFVTVSGTTIRVYNN
ncbi:hypothetical protein [uncultured Formosa sp.]|uniref:hypothetical protein n=1 Tax=uncultured Formosa sp. TaxID=255435 RepID=UPI002616C365|nr:hypothetical protein [uncultured Formosa sp.]